MTFNPLKFLLGDKSGSYWVKAGSLTLMSRVSNVGFAFLNFYLLIRILDVQNFGIWTLYITVCTLLELLKNGFIGNPLIKHAAETKAEDYKNVLSASLMLNGLVGLLEVSLLIVFSYTLPHLWDATELHQLFLIYIIPSILLIPISHLTFIQQANLDFKGGFFASLFRYMSLFVFLVYFFTTKTDVTLTMLAWIQVVSFGGSAIISVFYGSKYFQVTSQVSKEWMLKLFHYGKYTLGTNLTSNVLRNIDTWMLGTLIGAPAVAIYNPAVRVANLFEVPTVALNTIVFPKLLKEVQDRGKESIKYLFEKSVGLLLAVMVPFVSLVVIFSEQVVFLVAGKGFEETAAVLQITMLYGLILPFNRQVGITLDAIGKPGTNFFFVLITTIANTIINYFLIIRMGVLGAAISTLISFAIAYVMNYFYFNRRYDISNLNIIKYSFGYYGQVFKILTRRK